LSEECAFEAYRSVINSGIESPRIVDLEYKQDNKCGYHVTWTRVRAPIFVVEKTSITYF